MSRPVIFTDGEVRRSRFALLSRTSPRGTVDGVWHRCFDSLYFREEREEHMPADWAQAGLQAGGRAFCL
eukprot:5990562-Pyramimonas_sp.AAC.1